MIERLIGFVLYALFGGSGAGSRGKHCPVSSNFLVIRADLSAFDDSRRLRISLGGLVLRHALRGLVWGAGSAFMVTAQAE